MTQSFNIGDRVVFNQDYPAKDDLYITAGDLATVIAIGSGTGPHGTMVEVHLDAGPLGIAVYSFRLDLLKAPAPAIAPFAIGDRVVLNEDYGFSDKGDAGAVVSIDYRYEGSAVIRFDGGAQRSVPFCWLAKEVREFRFSTSTASLSFAFFSTEQAAADFAADSGCESFEVVEIIRVAKYTVQTVPAATTLVREAA